MRFLLASLLVACVSNNNPPAGDCDDLTGTWHVTGTCGDDTCVVTQTACSTHLQCSAGAASYTGSVSGDSFTYSGTSAGGIPATCTGTVSGDSLTATCDVSGPTCSVSGERQ